MTQILNTPVNTKLVKKERKTPKPKPAKSTEVENTETEEDVADPDPPAPIEDLQPKVEELEKANTEANVKILKLEAKLEAKEEEPDEDEVEESVDSEELEWISLPNFNKIPNSVKDEDWEEWCQEFLIDSEKAHLRTLVMLPKKIRSKIYQKLNKIIIEKSKK